MTSDLRVAVVGAGPAGIYASDILAKSGLDVSIDLIERLPVPFGLVRYGVAPDHPRIKGIVNSLHEMLDAFPATEEGAPAAERRTIRFIGNVEVGRDIALDELRERYHAVILATGAIRDASRYSHIIISRHERESNDHARRMIRSLPM
mgnify:CR=1 FL=1